MAGHIFATEETGNVNRLGGMTNHTYAVEIKRKKFLFRLSGEGTEQLINRKDEKVSSELASKIGVATELIYFNAETRVPYDGDEMEQYAAARYQRLKKNLIVLGKRKENL